MFKTQYDLYYGLHKPAKDVNTIDNDLINLVTTINEIKALFGSIPDSVRLNSMENIALDYTRLRAKGFLDDHLKIDEDRREYGHEGWHALPLPHLPCLLCHEKVHTKLNTIECCQSTHFADFTLCDACLEHYGFNECPACHHPIALGKKTPGISPFIVDVNRSQDTSHQDFITSLRLQDNLIPYLLRGAENIKSFADQQQKDTILLLEKRALTQYDNTDELYTLPLSFYR